MADPVAVTGMSVITPVADTPQGTLNALRNGRSAVTLSSTVAEGSLDNGLLGDLSDDDIVGRLADQRARLKDADAQRLKRLARRAPRATRYAIWAALEALLDAGLADDAPTRGPETIGVVLAGHNTHPAFLYSNMRAYAREPMDIDPLYALHALDTDLAASVSEAIGAKGPLSTCGGACASGNLALRSALHELRQGDCDIVVVVGTIFDISPVDYYAMMNIEAICDDRFNDRPETASRPFDVERAGFVPSHGAACMILERADHAAARGAHRHAQLLGTASTSDGNHLPNPSQDGQRRCMGLALRDAGIAPEAVDLVSAHATSTQVGDITEISSIRESFGAHASKLLVNAPKSMLGHTCWSAALVEGVVAIEQLKTGLAHRSWNVFTQAPEVELDICRDDNVERPLGVALNNAFGFGGINSVSVFAHPGWTA